ncbi:MAG: apolipoprotein N-acyltransferase [Verrucomicrobiaceae bacterium]
MKQLSTLALSSLFGVLFYLAYYLWWPFVFFVTIPIGLLAGKPLRVFEVVSIGLATTLTWLAVYQYFNTFSELGLAILALYHGVIVALVVLSASWLRKKTGSPMSYIVPVVWVGGEFWRMSGSLGMPFGLLAQPAYEQLWMIQVSDLGGSYVLSFAMAMVGGLLTDLICEKRSTQGLVWNSVKVPVFSVMAAWVFVAAYSTFRLHQSENSMTAGPVLAIIQTDVPTRFDGSMGPGSDPNILMQELLELSTESLTGSEKPEMIIWPESPSGIPPLNREWLGNSPEHQMSQRYKKLIQKWVDQEEIPVLVGSQTVHGEEKRNTALRFDPGTGQLAATQDKIHLFPVGEYLPWEGTFAHKWLEANVAEGRNDWFTPGTSREIFTLANETEASWRYVVGICNEIIYPKDVGTFLPAREDDKKPIGFVVNIANNGGFLRNRAMVHNHYLLPFRAVEGRLGIARSANTGISCFVKPTGEIYGEITNSSGDTWTGKGAPELDHISDVMKFRKEHKGKLSTDPEIREKFMVMVEEIKQLRAEAGISGQRVEPVHLDSRRTLYSRTGDLFGKLTLVILLLGVAGAFWESLRCIGPSLKKKAASRKDTA